MTKRLLTIATMIAATAAPAFAHVSADAHIHAGGEPLSMLSGLIHPLTGVDHIAAMLAVGLWAALQAGRARIVAPLAFVSAMIAGYGLTLSGLSVPAIEPGILASVIVIGLLTAAAVRAKAPVVALVAGVFGLLHGAAHGAELGAADAAIFGFGMVAATIALHGAGFIAALSLSPRFARLAGFATVATGAVLAFG